MNATYSNDLLLCIMPKQAFDDSSSWTGSSMRLVGALTRLSERRMLRTDTPPIVVCIPCAEGTFLPGMPRRHSEYGDYNHPVSQAHGEFVATTLHPYITNRFRVKDGSEHISTIGCSLGGQASLQLVLRYPEVRCNNRIIPDSESHVAFPILNRAFHTAIQRFSAALRAFLRAFNLEQLQQ
jgi:enterochelin esterase-like enzyme